MTVSKPIPVKKASSVPGGVIFAAIVIAIGALMFGIVKLGFLHPDPQRCGQELLYYWWQSKLPVVEVKHYWGWIPSLGGQPMFDAGAVTSGGTATYTGGCVGLPSPWNLNIMASFAGIIVALLTLAINLITTGAGKRRMVGIIGYVVVTILMLPHWPWVGLAMSIVKANPQAEGDMLKAALARIVLFVVVGLVFTLISKFALNDPKPSQAVQQPASNPQATGNVSNNGPR